MERCPKENKKENKERARGGIMKQREMFCDRCHKTAPISEMRYELKGKDGRIALCSGCRSEKAVEKKEKTWVPEKKAYLCSRCRYKFKFDEKGVSSIKCPYCGKTDRVRAYNPEMAESIVKEVRQMPD